MSSGGGAFFILKAYLKQKSQTLINQLDMQLVWAVADNNSASCDRNQMRWHHDTRLPIPYCRHYPVSDASSIWKFRIMDQTG